MVIYVRLAYLIEYGHRHILQGVAMSFRAGMVVNTINYTICICYLLVFVFV